MVEGVISRVSEKPWQNKKFYSFALSGQEGWFSLGLKRPPPEGTSVRFEFKTNSKGYKEVDGPIEVRTDGEAQSAPEASSFRSNGSGKNNGSTDLTKDQYFRNKEARDVRNDELREIGATRNTAIAFIDLAIKHEAVKLPAGVAKREGFLWDLLNRYVDKLRGKEVQDTPAQAPQESTTTAPTKDPEMDPDTWN